MGVKRSKFNPNDRPAIRQQIQGIHAAVATLTKQPVFMLSNMEAEALTKSLCDVLDYHEINLTEAGGAGGLYLALGLTAYSIYQPRLKALRQGGGVQIEQTPTAPSTNGEATTRKSAAGMMDFTADIDPAETGQSIM